MIINLTQHLATPEQAAAGVCDLPESVREELTKALTFVSLPTAEEIEERAQYIAGFAVFNGLGGDLDDDPAALFAMIGGAPYLMAPLEKALADHGVRPVYAFSQRVSVEAQQPDGTVLKTNVFKHVGFVRP